MTNLRAFYNDFCSAANETVAHLWRYEEFETKFGVRREMQFIGQTALLMQLPDDTLSLLVAQTQEHRVYKHVAYMLSYLVGTQKLKMQIHGQALQAITRIEGIDIEYEATTGTLEREDWRGNIKEYDFSRIKGVILSRKQ
jgi:hypothetical protein